MARTTAHSCLQPALAATERVVAFRHVTVNTNLTFRLSA
jgi:hypothetical protein